MVREEVRRSRAAAKGLGGHVGAAAYHFAVWSEYCAPCKTQRRRGARAEEKRTLARAMLRPR